MKRRYEKICGIYKITNLINDKVYIGQSVDIYERWHCHKYDDNRNSAIHAAIKKYGLENFSFEILETIPQKELNDREKYWINYYNSYKNGYNCTIGGDGAVKYDYEQIYNLYLQGYTCKQIAEHLCCKDTVITKALRSYHINEKEVRRRNNFNPGKPIVAIDISTNSPLKSFINCKQANIFFNMSPAEGSIYTAVKKHYRYKGYYWEYLSENNTPRKELTTEEFLSYQQLPLTTYSQAERENISQRQRTVERPAREELKQLIRTTPFTKIGEQFGVSDNAIRKWCDFYKLPRKVSEIKSYSDEEWLAI